MLRCQPIDPRSCKALHFFAHVSGTVGQIPSAEKKRASRRAKNRYDNGLTRATAEKAQEKTRDASQRVEGLHDASQRAEPVRGAALLRIFSDTQPAAGGHWGPGSVEIF